MITIEGYLGYNRPFQEGGFESWSLRDEVLSEKKRKNLLARHEHVTEEDSTLHLPSCNIWFTACHSNLREKLSETNITMAKKKVYEQYEIHV